MFAKIPRLILCGFVIFLPALFLLTVPAGARGDAVLRAHFIDVGYADAILLELPDRTAMLVDAGDAKHSSRVISYLQSRQIKKLDTVVITHPHENHFGGLRKIIGRIPVGRVFHNGDPNAEKGFSALLDHLKRKQVPIAVLRRGQKLERLPDPVTVEVLNPTDFDSSPNDNSLVLRLTHGDVAFLFLADIGPSRQDALLAAFPDIRKADCVVVPHHGGPLSDAFIETFQEKLFIVSTGPNRWGLPQEDQLERLNGSIYRTDKNGTIVVESEGAAVKVISWTPSGN